MHSVALILLACCSGAVLAALIEPKGELVSSGQVQVGQAFRVFGTDYPGGTYIYMNAPIGRLSIGAVVTDTLPKQQESLTANLIQPVEVFTSFQMQSLPRMYQSNITGDLLHNMTLLVRENFWQETNFTAIGGQLLTWDGQKPEGDTKSNTFQVALLFGKSSTFALFNYDALQFTSHLGTSVSARFTRAASTDMMQLPFSGAEVGRLATASSLADQTAGRFLYRIDSWPPVRGGCLSADPNESKDRTLSVSRDRDSVLGGAVAIVSGRCQDAASVSSAECRISTIDGSLMSFGPAVRCDRCGSAFLACAVPPALTAGAALLELRMMLGGSASSYSHVFSIESPDDARVTQVFLNDSMTNWMQLEPASLAISYDTAWAMNASLKLQVVGYSEAGLTRIDRPEDLASLIKVLYDGPASSSGSMNLAGKTVRCAAGNADCENYHVGFLRIVDNAKPPNQLKSRMVPLGWFVHPYYLDKGETGWPAAKCKAWQEAKSSPEAQRVTAALQSLACPGQLNEALANPGQFLQATYCPSLPDGCGSAVPSQKCFVSRPGIDTQLHGVPAAVCCYSQSTGSLIYQEQYQGSDQPAAMGTGSLRSHPHGQLLSRASAKPLLPGQASYLSTWYWDALPRLHCCRWSPGTGDCQLRFMQARPTPRTSLYSPGRTTYSVGDPHLTSLNGRRHLFNGLGEYWLLSAGRSIAVQGRYARGYVTQEASFLTALAAQPQMDTGKIVEVLANSAPPEFSVMYRRAGYEPSQSVAVKLFVGGPAQMISSGVTVQINATDRLFMQLSNGEDTVGLELRLVSISSNFSYLDMLLTLSPALKGRTRGLLGQWTEDPTKEFIDIYGNIVPFGNDSKLFDEKFSANNQLLNASVSLFGYSGRTSRVDGFANANPDLVTYKPVYDVSSVPALPDEVSVCGASADCRFDYRLTKNAEVAKATMVNGWAFDQLRASAEGNASSCDVPALPGVRIDQPLTAGSSLVLTCAQPLVTSRSGLTIVCTRLAGGNLTWQPEPTGLGFQCQMPAGLVNQANIGLIVGIVVPCVILLLVAIVLVIFFVHRQGDKPPMPATREEKRIFLPSNTSAGQPYSGQPIMAKGQPPHQAPPPTSDEGNRRNPRGMPPPYGGVNNNQPKYYGGGSSVDSDDGHAQFAPVPMHHQRAGGVTTPPPHQQAPVPAQRRSFDRSSNNQVMMQDDRATFPQQQQQPPPPQPKPKPKLSHSEVV